MTELSPNPTLQSPSWISKCLSDLPPPEPLTIGWIIRQSRSMPGIYYYYQMETGYSQWDPPVARQSDEAPNDSVLESLPQDHHMPKDEMLNSSKRKPPDAEASEENKRPKPNEPKEVRVLHLLKKHNRSRRPASWRSPNITISLDEARAELEEFLSILKESHTSEELRATFEELARTESDCSSAKRGGDLGFFGRFKMQPAFEKSAFNLEIGELSNIVETSSGAHILLRIG